MTQKICDCEALPPTGDVGELIETCRRYADSLVGINDLICGPLMARCALLEAAAEIERLRAALRTIADGKRDADQSYATLFAEVVREARAILSKHKEQK